MVVCFILLLGLMPSIMAANDSEDLIEVEAPPEDPTIGTSGPMKEINYMDENLEGKADFISLFTTDYGQEVFVKRLWVAVQVDSQNRVTRMINPSHNGQAPVWEEEQYLEIPDGGYVLLAHDDSWANKDFRKFLATNFTLGDESKLRKNGELISVRDLMTGEGPQARIELSNQALYTETASQTDVSGQVRNLVDGSQYELYVNGEDVFIAEDGSFTFPYTLESQTNYIDVEIYQEGQLHDRQSLIVFRKENLSEDKHVFLWVEQGPNARRFQTSDSIYDMLVQAKDAGVTAVALDVKGVEGFASYQKNDLTNRPYVSEMTAPARSGSNPDLDLLEEFIRHGHELGLEVHAALNVFAEGSIAHNEFAVLDEHLDWEEQVYRHEDGGDILRLRESEYGRSGALVAFVNPANEDVRDYQLRSFEEVIKNYDVDGVLLDRGRYDNYFADFSDESKRQFEEFLHKRGKELENWPADIFTYDGASRIDGPLINEWYTYRAQVIKTFTEEVRGLVDQYNVQENRAVELSAYVGSWYETYYLNGVNWASPNFEYDPRLQFPQEELYDEAYYETGYTDQLDFLMIGTYQRTAAEINRYITLGNILTNGEIPLYAGMALVNVQEPSLQREVFQAGLNNTNGLMLFDYSQANFDVIQASIKNVPYVKNYDLGISNPIDSHSSITGDFFNVNRNDNNLNVYSSQFGPTTGTNTWGVEAVVDGSGTVINVVNKQQAINWNWAQPENNNSVIPDGGFVISALDGSGIREKRQLVARSYQQGDQVRAALYRGFLDYEEEEFPHGTINFQGNVEVIGVGNAAVYLNEEEVTVLPNGDIEEELAIELGENIISIRIEVDGYITHQREFTVYGTWAELDLLEQLGELKDLVTEYIQHPPGIRQSLVVRLNKAEESLLKAKQFLEDGQERKALQEKEKARSALEKFTDHVQRHEGNHIKKEHAKKLVNKADNLKSLLDL